jgi:hypothetical protein
MKRCLLRLPVRPILAVKDLIPLTIFDTKNISATHRQRIETAVGCGGKHVSAMEIVLSLAIARTARGVDHHGPAGNLRVMITGPPGLSVDRDLPARRDAGHITELVSA